MATPWDYVEAAARGAGVKSPASDAMNGIIMRMLMNPGEPQKYLKGLEAMGEAGVGGGTADPWEIWAAEQATRVGQNQPDILESFRQTGGKGYSGSRFAEPAGDFLAPLPAGGQNYEPPGGDASSLWISEGARPADDIGTAEQAFRRLMMKPRFVPQRNMRGGGY